MVLNMVLGQGASVEVCPNLPKLAPSHGIGGTYAHGAVRHKLKFKDTACKVIERDGLDAYALRHDDIFRLQLHNQRAPGTLVLSCYWPARSAQRSAQAFQAPVEAPYLKIELAIEPELTDIVAERFDAGARFGDQILKDMTAA